ncbi:hypothetical protein CCACVL1_08018 [Corchorus capsularis]|uniref:MYB-CC type transcription factor LHEQLE-containing domain-containing protein n=1 Tax=Corchorus capsularis TaxID=210143 RepID=A0A1R3J2Q4_COCAP|nr:hypothetical protein CCACVL1_08018 [Corchorus capsularis]
MAEIESEMKIVSTENNACDEFKRVAASGKEIVGQGACDVNVGLNAQVDNPEHQLQSGENNSLLALQEIQGPSTPVKTNGAAGGNEVVEIVKEKPKLILTNDFKPRVRWTHELHACFVDAVNQLEATPKTVLDLMDIEGLGISVSEIVGASRGVSSLKSVSSRTNASRGRKAKQTAKSQEEIDEKLHLRIETQKHVQRCLEAQRRYLGMALERASKKLGDGYLGNAATENTILHGQASGTLAAISDVRTMATIPEFYVNQQNQYPTYDTLTPQANVSLQEGYEQ